MAKVNLEFVVDDAYMRRNEAGELIVSVIGVDEQDWKNGPAVHAQALEDAAKEQAREAEIRAAAEKLVDGQSGS